MEVTVEVAGWSLPELIDAARSGHDVILLERGRPVAKITPISKSGFRIGGLEHLAGTEPDFLEPMSEEELRLWEGGDASAR